MVSEKFLKSIESAKKALARVEREAEKNGCILGIERVGNGSKINYIEIRGRRVENFAFYKCLGIVFERGR